MFKKVLVMMLALVAVPTFALASWQVSASSTPARDALVVPSATSVTSGTYSTSASKALITVSDDDATVSFTVPTIPNYTLISVTVDGKILAPAASYTITKALVSDGPLNGQILIDHNIVANYASAASNSFKIKSIATPGGWISESQTVPFNTVAKFKVYKNPNHSLFGVYKLPVTFDSNNLEVPTTFDNSGVPVGGTPIVVSNGTYNITADKAYKIYAKFTADVKPLAASIGIPAALSATPGSVLDLIGSTTPGYKLLADTTGTAVSVSYAWTGDCGQAVGLDGSKRKITVPALGSSCTVTLTATTSDNQTASASSTITGAQIPVGSCLGCHSGDPNTPDKTAFTGKGHDAAGKTCSDCHNPTGTLSHAYKPVATILCTQCHGFTKAQYLPSCATASCHGSSDVHTIAAPATTNCATCHTAAVNHLGKTVPAVTTFTFAHSAKACASCHTSATHGAAAVACSSCHTKIPTLVKTDLVAACATCHNTTSQHTVTAIAAPTDTTGRCIDCHAVGLKHLGNFVNDNNGVRSIVDEFTKRSHHITGATPTDAQCVVCHLEGKVSGTAVVVDATKHMVDDKIHLRNADTNADFVWGGTEHTNMDNFCFSCHDSDGALAVPATFAGVAGFTGTAANPFGDTLKNSYDQVARAGVVDVKTAFLTTNASHHAVSGQRYTYRFSTVANATQWAARTGKPMPANSEIAELSAGYPNATINAFDPTETYDVAGPHEGGMATLYEADKFVYTYIPLGETKTVADNSVLHCGDCHTVGQWKVASSTSADGSATPVAIGAHGSANDYLLRNSLGTDALHSSQTYVCFNCHKGGQAAAFEHGNDTTFGNGPQVLAANAALYADLCAEGFIAATATVCTSPATSLPTWKAGWNAAHPNIIAGQVSGYATAHAVSAFHAQCVADSSNQVGSAGTPATPVLSRVWFTTGGGHKDRTLDFVPAAGATASMPTTASEGGNITGIGCTNCHNSGLRQGWGGIHGGNNTYTDGLGRTQTTYRFMPGMGNYRYAPPGGWDGNDLTDSTLTTMPGAGVGAGKPMGGCYTNSATDANNGFSSCAHHGTSTAQTTAGLQAAGGRATYGGGSASTPTAAEPTVREATAGNSLLTRPLKY